MPPHDLDAEAAVLSAVILDPPRLDEVAWLRPEHFYSEAHRRIWEAVLELRVMVQKIDVVTVGTWLKDHDRIAQVGGMQYLIGLLDAAPAVLHVGDYARTVADKAQLRKMIATCQQFAARGYLEPDRSLVAEAESAIAAVAHETGGRVKFMEADEIFAPIDRDDPWVCKALRLMPGRVVLVAGDPESGKTLAVQDLALCVAAGSSVWGSFSLQRSGPVLYGNWDQPDSWTVRKRFVRLARARHLDMGELIAARRLRLMHQPQLFLDDESHLNELRALCREHVLLVVDALTGAAGGLDENKPEIGRALRQLGAVSDATGCLIIVIHHARKANDDPRARGARDDIHAMRGSGSIAGAAGTVLMMRAIKKGARYGVRMARSATSSLGPLEPFALDFKDVTEREDGTGDPQWGVRVEYVDPAELAEAKQKAQGDQAVSREQYIAQVSARLLEIIKQRPRLGSGDLYELAPKMRKQTFQLGLRLLVEDGKVKDLLGKGIDDKSRKEWVAC